MNCPKCGNQDVYRKRLESLTIYCDRCGHQWEGNQVRKSLANRKTWSKIERMYMYVSVWLCPKDKSKYSFGISNGHGIVYFKEFPEDPYVSGCYNSIEEALTAGMEEAKSE
ncbi:hypothetical protein V0288_23755 [Pannus brasiliensis CCIBt3594]|uniref:Uncharacterized protein n=1 Tax=Pannus brasiliensis CCIBt3594 TaxID=1427578 RepID=A0AAW9R185_9CHRO